MNTQEPLTSLLQRWLRLTRAESAAIRAEAWPTLSAIHADKARLRQPLAEAKRDWQVRRPLTFPQAQNHKPVRAAIGRLIALEQQNADLVALRQQKTKLQLAHLGSATRNLLKIKKSYASEASLPRHSWI
jgi:hypothetical protein